MDLTDLPEAVQKLAGLPEPFDLEDGFKYRSLGLKRADIPALIELVRNTGALATAPVDADELPAQFWLPIHAWRALGEMAAVEAAPAMIDTLRWIDDTENDVLSDIVQENMPVELAQLGAKILPLLAEYLFDEQHGQWARLAAAETMNLIGQEHKSARGEVTQSLMRALEDYPAEEPTFNSFLITYLMEQKAVEAAELVEQVFASGRVDESVMGDWEDFQVGVGLLEKRLTPPKTNLFDPFAEERTGEMNFLRGRSKEDKKTKKKRKEAKETRKKNRKHKKR